MASVLTIMNKMIKLMVIMILTMIYFDFNFRPWYAGNAIASRKAHKSKVLIGIYIYMLIFTSFLKVFLMGSRGLIKMPQGPQGFKNLS